MADKELRQIPLAAMFIALGVAMPQLFHMFGAGSVFLPMFLPLYLGAMFLSWKYSAVIAVLTPVFSFLISGMPPVVPPILFLMIIELLSGTLFISIVYFHLNKNMWIALIGAIVIGRIVYLIVISVFLPLFGFESKLLTMALVLKSFPGIILQLLVIPAAVKFIKGKYSSLSHNK